MKGKIEDKKEEFFYCTFVNLWSICAFLKQNKNKTQKQITIRKKLFARQ